MRLSDDRPAAAPVKPPVAVATDPQAPPPEVPTQRSPVWLLPAVAAPVLALGLFLVGHTAMDHLEPKVAGAAAAYALAVVVAGGGLYYLLKAEGVAGRAVAAAAGCVALPVAYYAGQLGELYGFAALFLLLIGERFLVWYGVALALGLIVLAIARKPSLMVSFLEVGGLGLGLGIAGAALYHLATLEHQADLARAAHQVPGLGVVGLLVLLASAAVLARRRADP
jgi:hypothetical protein